MEQSMPNFGEYLRCPGRSLHLRCPPTQKGRESSIKTRLGPMDDLVTSNHILTPAFMIRIRLLSVSCWFLWDEKWPEIQWKTKIYYFINKRVFEFDMSIDWKPVQGLKLWINTVTWLSRRMVYNLIQWILNKT